MRKLHGRWGARVHFVDVLVRQAHPGPGVETYHSPDAKLVDARAYMSAENIPWPVLVDDLQGRVHQVYGGLADPTYLIGVDGRVAFYLHWTHAPTLDAALEELEAAGGSGIVRGGFDRTPHLTAAFTDGWRGLRRGTPQSVIDMETSLPSSAAGLWLGYRLRPLLAPLTLRAERLPAPARLTVYGALLGAGVAMAAVSMRRSDARPGGDGDTTSAERAMGG